MLQTCRHGAEPVHGSPLAVCCPRADCLTDQRERTQPTAHEDRRTFPQACHGGRQVSQDEAERPAAPSDPPRADPECEKLERELRRLRAELAQLRQALESRPVIDQARGMVMAIGPCTSEAAWTVLVETSQRTNTKLRKVAEALVASTDGTTAIPLPLRSALAASLRTHRSRHTK